MPFCNALCLAVAAEPAADADADAALPAVLLAVDCRLPDVNPVRRSLPGAEREFSRDYSVGDTIISE